MLPDQVSNPGPLTYESGALPIALRGSAFAETELPYFFGYKTRFFSFQNNPKVLDPSCKTDLELWHCLGRAELVL